MQLNKVAIVGAGLSGMSLALLLKKINVDVTIYEVRQPDARSEGAIMLSPNALKTLDHIGIFSRIERKAYSFRNLHTLRLDFETIDVYEMGNKDRFGYDAIRVYRQVVLDEFRSVINEAGIPIVYAKKFSHVVQESDDGVRFAFADGDGAAADLLVGADGIHSRVRNHIAPEVKTVFSNILAVSATVPMAEIQIPSDLMPRLEPLSLIGPAGAFVLAPQNAEGSEAFVGLQNRTHDRTRAEWDALAADKEQLRGILMKDYAGWNNTVRSALDAVPLRTVNMWPFYNMPKLSSWKFHHGRMVILGDAAHAISPAAGQGVNQAFEDVHSLSLLVEATREGKVSWQEALQWWQQYRQTRFEGVQALTEIASRRRMPGFDYTAEGPMDSTWIFAVDICEDVTSWLESR